MDTFEKIILCVGVAGIVAVVAGTLLIVYYFPIAV